jgi:hypothetical protein
MVDVFRSLRGGFDVESDKLVAVAVRCLFGEGVQGLNPTDNARGDHPGL